MANYEATKYDFSGANLQGVQGVNTGIIVPWGNASVPSGFLECNGAAVSRSTYATLFAIVGTTYGAGNGSTTFNVPNLTDRVVVSRSPTKSLATTGGANTVASSGNISGSIGNTTIATPTLASHNHANQILSGAFIAPSPGGEDPNTPTFSASPTTVTISSTGGGGAHTHPHSSTFSGTANSVLQPYLTVMYIIKT
jgi:microcystin-dependent protein